MKRLDQSIKLVELTAKDTIEYVIESNDNDECIFIFKVTKNSHNLSKNEIIILKESKENENNFYLGYIFREVTTNQFYFKPFTTDYIILTKYKEYVDSLRNSLDKAASKFNELLGRG